MVLLVYAECSTTSFPTHLVGTASVPQYSAKFKEQDNGIGGGLSQAASQKQKDMVFMTMTTEINKLAVAPHIMALDYYSKPALLEANMLCTVYEQTSGLQITIHSTILEDLCPLLVNTDTNHSLFFCCIFR